MEDTQKNAITTFIENGNFLTSDQGKALFLETSAETIATAALDCDMVFEQLELLIRDHSDIGSKRGIDLLVKILEIEKAMLIIGMHRQSLNNFQLLMRNKQ